MRLGFPVPLSRSRALQGCEEKAAKRASQGRRAFVAVHGCAVGKPPNRLKREGIREADKTGRAFLWLLSCRHKKVTRLSHVVAGGILFNEGKCTSCISGRNIAADGTIIKTPAICTRERNSSAKKERSPRQDLNTAKIQVI